MGGGVLVRKFRLIILILENTKAMTAAPTIDRIKKSGSKSIWLKGCGCAESGAENSITDGLIAGKSTKQSRLPKQRQRIKGTKAMGERGCLTIFDMIHALLKKCQDMFILDAVIDFFSVAARLDNLHLAQAAQMMRDARFGNPNGERKLGNVYLTGGEGGQYPHPGGVAEGAKQLRDAGSRNFVKVGIICIHNVTIE